MVVIDPYNDFVSMPGKSWLLTRRSLREVGTLEHLRALLDAARGLDVPVCYAPHARFTPQTYQHRRFLSPAQHLSVWLRMFARGSWGGRFREPLAPRPGEFVATEHLTSSGFVNTDLHPHLERRGIDALVLCGCLSNTCVESTARSAIELGYHVTIAADAVAAMSPRDHAAALESGYRMCAHRVASSDRIIAGWRS